HRAAQESLPLRDAFAVLFFVSVVMLFDPNILIDKPLPILATFTSVMAIMPPMPRSRPKRRLSPAESGSTGA
ncbi:hypothetical protein AB9F35_36020, partial [Rhizobium leguminosarum]|uniref:hypothetical protein n=1 Tax=Rhizobium leguminosarum TaxID=384 RepID=UPI003F9A8BC2